MRFAVPKETAPHERRVALVPETVSKLVKAGHVVGIEAQAGVGAACPDRDYEAAGAKIMSDPKALWGEAEILLKIQKPTPQEIALLREGTVLIALLQPLVHRDLVQQLAQKRVTAFSLDMIPRITRAQPMDVLSSQSTVAGYKAVLLAANYLPRFLPMLSTAAGTIAPAKVFVLGAGVAGLQAIATAKRLGAVVQAFDVRPAVKEQVESLGAQFVGLALEEAADKSGYAKELSEEHKQKERELIAKYVKDADIVITTALVPGKRAPLLLTKEMVATMKPGSVVIDLAAEQGGNCELTQAGQEITANGVTVLGPINLPSQMSFHASQMFSRNLYAFLQLLLTKDGKLNLDFNDEIIKGSCVTHEGKVLL
ncbi:MAG: Re/Si-specific NAD(P)(+) transhydrogenase subunit alpha [Candidatus Bipolaricaulota bacterium]|nr:Re/Si-specific NAD(P)(+) transhydrogenase subunit alpha [Candidatus Bipolaricaulota bacterium]MCS7274367.1 Re/Si-specific NAD(P)(+) transhydrogenase subunit alpha [Candidatus Bipolaricaulota bacterium]MDW8111568.1 Re/Si-specific NAD(P)(+) transhydrogenase subunit alpha [Candidatus Bipolaricaulota bacterium]MDW8329787.1 Re/Si-specific NAD(P)(+) transhydrogenase subunit alpha [Candidatus Bipolaricaulota bacterium]